MKASKILQFAAETTFQYFSLRQCHVDDHECQSRLAIESEASAGVKIAKGTLII